LRDFGAAAQEALPYRLEKVATMARIVAQGDCGVKKKHHKV
jgi:hypothetical protein